MKRLEKRASESQELSPAGSAGGQIGQEEKEHGDAGKDDDADRRTVD